jgi:methyltransferase (TIGR00027 family)
MKPSEGSRTAEAAAAARARHHRYASPRVFEDPYALQLTSPAWRRIISNPALDWLVFRMLLRKLRPVGAQVVARSRYAEDRLADALARGIGQYVIVGAGLDSFALRRRDLEDRIRVFELDHPATQAAKRDRLARLRLEPPRNLELVPVDFEQDDLGRALALTSYRGELPAFYSWLGTTPYLPEAATLTTLRSISTCAASGSEIVFDYLVPADSLSDHDRRIVQAVQRFAARRGEPIVGTFSPERLHEAVGRLGFDVLEDVSGRAQHERYFSGRSDGFSPMPSSHFAHLRLTPAGRCPAATDAQHGTPS